MPRPDQSAKQRQKLLPIFAPAFAELGYGLELSKQARISVILVNAGSEL